MYFKICRFMDWIKDYLKEISVIIIGLCITYWGDSLVDRYYEKKDDREYMELLVTELKDNIRELEKMRRYYERDRNMAAILKSMTEGRGRSSEKGVAQEADSLLNQHRYYHYWMLKDNVFSMMKGAGTFQRMEKQKAAIIYECYEYMNTALHMGEVYREKRFQELLEHMAVFGYRYSSPDMTIGMQLGWIAEDRRFSEYFVRTVPPMTGSAMGICVFTEKKVEEVIEILKAD